MLDTMKLLGSITMAAVVGFNALPPKEIDREPATVLVGQWPASQLVAPTEQVNDDYVKQLDAKAKRLDELADKADAIAKEMETRSQGFETYRPKPDSPVMNDGECRCNCDGDCLSEADVRRIAADEYQVQKQVDLQQSMRAGGYRTSSGGSSGGSVVMSPTPSIMTYRVGSPVVQPTTFYAAKRPQTITYQTQSASPVAAKTAVSTRDYVAASGCTVRETTYSDGSTSSQTISCPVQRRPGLFGRRVSR